MGPAPSRPRAGPGFRSRRRDGRRATRGRCHRPRRHVPSNLNRAIPKRLVASSGCGEPAASSGGKLKSSLVHRMLTGIGGQETTTVVRQSVQTIRTSSLICPERRPSRGAILTPPIAQPHIENPRALAAALTPAVTPLSSYSPQSLSRTEKKSIQAAGLMNTHPRLEQSARRRHRVLLTASPAHPPCSGR